MARWFVARRRDTEQSGSPRRRGTRRARGIVTFVTLPALTLGTATVAGAYGMSRLADRPAGPPCTPQTVVAPARNSFDVRVLNASGTDGRATATAKELGKRGFRIVEAGNQPGLMSSHGEIAYGRDGLDEALLVAQQAPGVPLTFDGRQGTSVSLVIGADDGGLAPVPPPIPPRPEKIVVDVYNATWRTGLGSTIAEGLRERGFRTGRVGNDPQRSFLPDDTAIIRYGEDGEAAAKVLAQHVPNARLVRVDRADAQVVLVAGNRYSALTPAAQVPPPPPEPPKTTPTVTRPCTS